VDESEVSVGGWHASEDAFTILFSTFEEEEVTWTDLWDISSCDVILLKR